MTDALIRRKEAGQAWETVSDSDNQGGDIQAERFSFGPDDLHNLDTVPVLMVPAPGAGLYIHPMFCSWRYHAGATPYTLTDAGSYLATSNPDLFTNNSNTIWNEIPAAGFIDQPDDSAVFPQGAMYNGNFNPAQISPTTGADAADLDDHGLYLMTDRPGTYPDGDGTVTITLIYAVLPVP